MVVHPVFHMASCLNSSLPKVFCLFELNILVSVMGHSSEESHIRGALPSELFDSLSLRWLSSAFKQEKGRTQVSVA